MVSVVVQWARPCYVRRLTFRAAGLDEIDRLHDRFVLTEEAPSPFDSILRLVRISMRFTVPPSGPLVIVANHPIGRSRERLRETTCANESQPSQLFGSVISKTVPSDGLLRAAMRPP